MNILSHPRSLTRRCLRVVFLIFLGGLMSAHAFFPEPDPLILDVNTSAVVKVKGSGPGAAVVVTDVSNSSIVSDDLGGGSRSGPTLVEVGITALQPGTTTLTFVGTNNGQPTSGSITVIVLAPAGTSAQGTQIATAGDPVNTSNGEYFADEGTDLNVGGPMSLEFSRYVASGLSTDGLVVANLGTNRSHNFASRITTLTTSIKRVILPSGRTLRFDKVGTKWVLKSPLDVPFQLVESGGNFLLGHPESKQIWTYDNAGKLTKIEDGKGNAHTLTYTGANLTGVSDGLGRTLTLTYTSGRITKVADHAGREVNYTYTSGVLTAVQDYGGQSTLYANASGLPTSVTRPRGNTPFTQLYTGGKVISQTMGGHTSTLQYNAGNTVFTDPEGNTLTDFYDASGRLTSHVDQDGKPITMTYDSAGRRASVTNRAGSKTSFTYHALSGKMASVVNAEGRTTAFAYTARTLSGLVFYDLTKVTYPDGASRAFKYDAKGNLTQVTDENGKAWKYTFNARGQVVTATNPLGGVTTYVYDALGHLTSSQPPDLGATTYGYDAPRGRLNLITRPGGATVTIAYDSRDRITSITDPRAKVRSYNYNANDRVTKIIDADGKETNISYDVMDRVSSITDRLGNPVNYTYNSIGRLASMQDRNGNTFSATFNDRHLVESITDPGGQVWAFDHDDEGRVTGMYEPALPSPANPTNRLSRLGRLAEATDADGSTARIVRDAMQRITASVDPLGRQTNYAYDKMGRLLSVTEQGTAAAKFDRDALGNIIKITDPNGGVWTTTRAKSGQVTKNTDALGKSTTYTYTSRGRLSGATFPDATTTTLSYDAADNLTQQQFSHPQGPNLVYSYDNQGRMVSANGVTFEYDDEGRVINCPQGGQDYDAHYDAGGRLTSLEYRNSAMIVTYAYDARGRLVQVSDNVSNVDVDFTHDNQGRLTGITRTPGIDATFSYSPAGRLTQIQEGTVLNLQYTYNAAGDIITVDHVAPLIPAVTPVTQPFKYGKAGEITTAGYVYDTLGRMTAAPGKTFAWNGVSNLINCSGVELAYNGLGHLTSRTASSLTTQFQRHYALPGCPIVFADAPGASPDIAYVCTPDGKLLYSVDIASGDASFFHFDIMGSTLAVTNEAEAVVNAYAYGPYGEPLDTMPSLTTQMFTFLGRHGVRAEGSLYQMGARYYDPVTARFLSRDPLPPRPTDPESLNRYAYAAGNPLRYIDPTGCLDEVTKVAASVSKSTTNGQSIVFFADIFGRLVGEYLDDPDYDRARTNTPFRMELPEEKPPPAPDALDTPWEEPVPGPTSGADFFPPFPGTPVNAFPGIAINDDSGFDPIGTSFGGAGNDGLGGGGEGLGDDGLGGLLDGFGPAYGGGIFVAAGDINGDGVDDVLTVANSTISDNTTEGAQAGAAAGTQKAPQAVIDFYVSTYLALQSAGSQLLDKIIQSGGKADKATRDKLSKIDQAREIIGGVIEQLGGTVPAPPR